MICNELVTSDIEVFFKSPHTLHR